MPIYEFRCPKCGAVITKLCKMGETGQDIKCDICGHLGLDRKISGFASPGVGGSGGSCGSGCSGSCASCH